MSRAEGKVLLIKTKLLNYVVFIEHAVRELSHIMSHFFLGISANFQNSKPIIKVLKISSFDRLPLGMSSKRIAPDC